MMRAHKLNVALSLLLVFISSIALLMVLVGTGQTVSAADLTETSAEIVVNTTDDELNEDGDCSLREAIQASNTDAAVDACVAGSGEDTIEVPYGQYRLALEGAGENDNATGDLDITSSVKLNGAGAEITIIDGNNLDRVFHILGGATVEIRDVTILNGRGPDGRKSGCGTAGDAPCPGGNGGGILNQGALSLSASVVMNNTAGHGGTREPADAERTTLGGDGGHGGGLYNIGSLGIYMSTVRNNRTGEGGDSYGDCCSSGGRGGGIASTGTFTLTDTIVEENTTGPGGPGIFNAPVVPMGPSGDGGGIYNNGTSTIDLSQIRRNNTGGGVNSGHGGGLANAGEMTLASSTIRDNLTGNAGGTGSIHGHGYDAGAGGGIHNTGTLHVIMSTISANSTGSGGDGACAGPGDGGVGGGIANQATLSLVNSTVSGNDTGGGGEAWCGSPEYGAAGDGGGVNNTGTLDIDYCTITANSTGISEDGTAGSGGGVASNGDKVRIKNTILASNHSANGSPECFDAVISSGYNLIENSAGCNINGSSIGNILDQLCELAPLANYGGPTSTHALFRRSPAFDAGSCVDIDGNSVHTDQRGAVRPYTCENTNLNNGSFEDGDTGWHTHTTGTGPKDHDLIGRESDGFESFRGNYGVRLGGYEGVVDTAIQTITIPLEGHVTYWWKGITHETLPGRDGFSVSLWDETGQHVATLASYDDRDVRNTWRQDIVDVSAYAGQTLVLRFSTYNDNYFFTTVYLDEIRLSSRASDLRCDIGAYEADADPFHYVFFPGILN